MSTVQSNGARERWQHCADLAETLGCGKTHVHNNLYSRIKRDGLLQLLLEGDESSIAVVKLWPEYAEERVSSYTAPSPSPAPCSSSMQRLKLTAWFVATVGGLEAAKKALDFYERMETEMNV